MSILLPATFNAQAEPIQFMARMKDRAAKNFRWTAKGPLEDAMYLAYWSHIFGRDDDALEVCDFLSQFQFAGDFNLWTWIEGTLALYSRLLRARGELGQAAVCIRRIQDAGFVERRLEGSLLTSKQRNIGLTAAEGQKSRERDWRAIYAIELCLLIELGGSPVLPVERLEEMWQDNLSLLRSLVGADRPGAFQAAA